MARALVCAAAVVCATATATAEGLDPIIKTSVLPGHDVAQGESLLVSLSIVPPSDAPGDITVLLDGLGTRDGFVQRMWQTTFDCPYGGCPFGERPVPCAAGRVCFELPVQLDIALPVGRKEIPLSVVDASGRETRLSATVDVRPARDSDGDGMPDEWESRYSMLYEPNQGRATDDPDGDGISNLEEYRRGTNPRARYTRYFAEGSSGDRAPGLEQCYNMAALVRGQYSEVWMTLVGDGGRQLLATRNAINNPTAWCPFDRQRHPADRVVAVIVESELPIAIERLAFVGDPLAQAGGHVLEVPFSTLGSGAPSSHWMFADGGTDGELDTFFLAYNPGPDPIEATFTYRTDAGAVARRRSAVLPPGVRTTTWVNADEASLGRTAAWVDVTSTAPILVERAWRFNPPGRTVTQESASPGADDASSRWLFPDVDGTAPFDTAIVLANPDRREAVLDVNLLFTDGDERRAGQVRVAPGGRVSVPAAGILPNARASVEIISANGVRVVGERTLRGRDERGPWRIAMAGNRASATRWTMPAQANASELVVTNVSPFPARVEVHYFGTGTYGEDHETIVDIAPRRRLVLPAGGVDTMRATSLPTDRGTAEIVVEAERYVAVGGVARARSSAVAAAPVQ